MSSLPDDCRILKRLLRQQGYTARNAQIEKDDASQKICQTILDLAEYRHAKTVLWYIHCRSEVRTLPLFPGLLADKQKTIVIPYCTVDQSNNPALGLWRLDDLSELEPGMWGILEPPKQRWHEVDRKISPQQLDLVIVPGVGFDRNGGRLGNGKGYYDNLLATLKNQAVLIGVGFESQLFDCIPMSETDIAMDLLITERAVYPC